MLYLVIDVGTSGIISDIYDHDANVLKTINIIHRPKYDGDCVTQKVETWDQALDEILTETQNFLQKNKQVISGVFLTSQRSSLICLDKNLEALTDAIMWEDKRSAYIVDRHMENDAVFIEKTGCQLTSVYLAPKIVYIKEKYPDIYKKTHKFVSIADYLRLKLTGQLITDYTYASRTGIFNIKDKSWDKDLVNLLGIDLETLCEIEPPGITSANIKEEVSEKYQLGSKIPFVSSGGDQNASAVGLGIFKEKRLTLTLGTGGFLQTSQKNFKSIPGFFTNSSSIPNQYLIEGVIISVASILNYFHKTFYEELSNNAFYALVEEACKMEHNILHYPYYQGSGSPDWNENSRGSYLNISLSTSKLQMLSSILESTAFETARLISNYKLKGIEIEEIAVAGGLSKNIAYLEMLSNILNLKLTKYSNNESTSFGAYLVGISGLNESIDIEEVFDRKMLEKKEVIEVRRNEYYGNKFEDWLENYSRLYTQNSSK